MLYSIILISGYKFHFPELFQIPIPLLLFIINYHFYIAKNTFSNAIYSFIHST